MKSVWKGSIGFGLVNIPVKLFSAVKDSGLDFDMLDEKDHSRIRYKRINEVTRKEVSFDKIVKGYLLNKKYVVLDDQDFEDASPEKNRIIALENFVNISEINPIYYETSYYAEPEGQGARAYALLHKALVKSKKAGLARFVLRHTENLCVIHPMDELIVITKIRFPEEIRPHEQMGSASAIAINKKELDLGLDLIKQYTSSFNIKEFHDQYSQELMKSIKST